MTAVQSRPVRDVLMATRTATTIPKTAFATVETGEHTPPYARSVSMPMTLEQWSRRGTIS